MKREIGLIVSAAAAGIVGASFVACKSKSEPAGVTQQGATEKHACKGMNGCKGQGGGGAGDDGCSGKNSCKGKGGCATAKHTCAGKNECKGQGGCSAKGNCAGKNSCKGQGGCAAPVKK